MAKNICQVLPVSSDYWQIVEQLYFVHAFFGPIYIWLNMCITFTQGHINVPSQK